MNELSPRRTPRSPIASPRTPPQWKRPDEVMRKYRLKSSRQNLISRMNTSVLPPVPEDSFEEEQEKKRKNPFKVPEVSPRRKKLKEDNIEDESGSIFRLLGITDPQMNSTDNISEIISKIKSQIDTKGRSGNTLGAKYLSVDWSLRTKIRFMSPNPFPWTQTLKTCEEASGITGFVRCIDNLCGDEAIDTSPNAMFHQHCCYWQHPSLPWVQLFPRSRTSEDKTPSFSNQPKIKQAILKDWCDSFRSLYQLVRTRHCPYFYVIGNLFTCLFRAAGVHGCNETNVMLTPTTMGFRQLIKDEGIQFRMPLRKKSSGNKSSETCEEEEHDEIDDEDEVQEHTKEWLASLGVEEEEINRISHSQEMLDMNSKKKSDGDCDSLIYIEGCEAQAFYNFLINCKSIIPTTGPLNGIPPTLIAPVAFLGGSLLSLKVRESIVRQESENYYSIEIQGPIMPHCVFNLCHILCGYLNKFSVAFATVDTTKSFSTASKLEACGNKKQDTSKKPEPAFNQGSLSDCGLQQSTLTRFCSYDIDHYDSIKFVDELFSWS